jgi:hypothetical protein
MELKRNMGPLERIIRVILGTAFIVLPLVYASAMQRWMIIVGAILGASLILEGLLAWCPGKALLGLGKKYHQ